MIYDMIWYWLAPLPVWNWTPRFYHLTFAQLTPSPRDSDLGQTHGFLENVPINIFNQSIFHFRLLYTAWFNPQILLLDSPTNLGDSNFQLIPNFYSSTYGVFKSHFCWLKSILRTALLRYISWPLADLTDLAGSPWTPRLAQVPMWYGMRLFENGIFIAVSRGVPKSTPQTSCSIGFNLLMKRVRSPCRTAWFVPCFRRSKPVLSATLTYGLHTEWQHSHSHPVLYLTQWGLIYLDYLVESINQKWWGFHQ